MKTRSLKYALIIFCLLISAAAYSQQLTATDTSERSVRRYQSVIKKNRELVNFIEYSLRSRGVPKYLRNLAIIEPGLNHEIVSHAGAKGLWQFMVGHANHYGLSERDRADMYKSTKTVVSSLINLYKRYGNWITVVAAYNCGEGNIQKAVNKAGSKKYTDFAPYLPSETRGHVEKFLNASYATGELSQVLNDYYKRPATAKSGAKTVAKTKKPAVPSEKKTVVKPQQSTAKKGFSQTTLNGAYNLDVIASVLSISKSELLKWNPTVERSLNEKGESLFYLPEQKMIEFQMNRNRILSESLKKRN